MYSIQDSQSGTVLQNEELRFNQMHSAVEFRIEGNDYLLSIDEEAPKEHERDHQGRSQGQG